MKHSSNILFIFSFIMTVQITVKCNPGEQGTQRTRTLKKWQLDKVTRKQYEIINILWRKTKLFINIETTTAAYQFKQVNGTQNMFNTLKHQQSYQLSPSPSSSKTSTSSYIEFYYLDETNVKVKPKDANFSRHNKDVNEFHLKFNIVSNNTRNNSIRNTETTKKYIYTLANSFIGNKTCPYKTDLLARVNNRNESHSHLKQTPYMKLYEEPTTVYDKIKFFEMYDKHTVIYPKKTINTNERIDFNNGKKNNTNVQKILLEHVNQNIGFDHYRHKTKHAKKHIRESFKNISTLCGDKENLKLKNLSSIPVRETNNTMFFTHPIKSVPNERKTVYSYMNKSVLWSEYPFAAVYIYEPAQVHCDAAGISPHWLVTAGACLSRHLENLSGEGRSAFVAFCGTSWWQPERRAYVKHSLVHPRYHPRDKARRHLYNIGVVQVVISMLSCSGWSPIPLMSHQYTTGQEGSLALALGWGLDRYDTRYAFLDLPKWPLMVYEGVVHSDSCPGNIKYRESKRHEEEVGMKNVYCLSLPPYAGEENDPIHGSLLLVGGKLTALYLQEERRSWGEQSAQYTGTWRLIPWVLDVAREPEIEDTFTLEI